MNLDITKVKICVTIPLENVDEIRNVVCGEGAGVIGDYSFCSTSTKCIGTFMPQENSNPYIGEKGKLEYVEEEKLEVICDISIAKKVIEKIREVHPYEEPAIDIIPLLNENEL